MYAYFIGRITYMTADSVVLEVNNIGYNIKVSAQTIQNLGHLSGEVKLYTYTYVKEDALGLFGFLTREELELFKMMLTVNGIGPKGALSILSTLSVDTLRFAILSGDAKSIAKAPGVGAKSAERLIIDLKDKINAEDVFTLNSSESNAVIVTQELPAKKEAIEALTALGYSATDALKAVNQITCTEDTTVEEILKQALKVIMTL
ncbi:MAG: Holliday junction branch migration protein RuvA [Lachnospiraceae bacterium]|nr:Holliday junction branch migration protein RuvA [Lachnospiraceae bacterium]